MNLNLFFYAFSYKDIKHCKAKFRGVEKLLYCSGFSNFDPFVG